ILAANPKMKDGALFDSRPDIRSIILRTKTHKLTYTISPAVEDIADGYEATLEAIENKEFINLQSSTLATGPLKLNEAKDLTWSYTFPKTAKEKKIVLKLTTKYLGETISQKLIELHPRR